MRDLTDAAVVRELLRRHGMNPTKSLGQNFLIDGTVCPRMAEACGADRNTGVLEIGPGVGVLTAELAKRAGKVAAVELDKRLVPALKETLAGFENIEIIQGDALKLDLAALIGEHFPGMRAAVCANLPYYITSPVIMLLLESRLPLDSITVMVQREAAERLCARVGSRAAGAVTVAVYYYAIPELLFEVPRDSFLPAPNVDSAVIRLTPRPAPPVAVADEAGFFRMVKAAFGQRRKTAANAVSAGMGLNKDFVAAAVARASFEPAVRAESFTLEELANLYNEIAAPRL